MKSMIIVALALVAVAAAAPLEEGKVTVNIVSSEFEQTPEGAFKYGFEDSEGSKREEEGSLKEVLDEENKPHKVVVVRGSYSYIRPDGVQETITYIADENGFSAKGPSIPQSPARR